MAAREASRGLRLQQRLNRSHGKELICPSLCPFLVRPPAARPLSNVFQPLFLFFFIPITFLSLSLLLRGGPRPSKGFSSIRGNGNVQNGRPTSPLPLRFLEGRRCNTRVKWKWSVIKDVDDSIPPRILRLATDQTVRFYIFLLLLFFFVPPSFSSLVL